MPREGGEGRAGGPHAALATLNGDRDYKVPAQLITIDRNPSTSLRLARPKTTPPDSRCLCWCCSRLHVVDAVIDACDQRRWLRASNLARCRAVLHKKPRRATPCRLPHFAQFWLLWKTPDRYCSDLRSIEGFVGRTVGKLFSRLPGVARRGFLCRNGRIACIGSNRAILIAQSPARLLPNSTTCL